MEITTESVYNQFQKDLLRFIKKRIKNTDAANDLLQEVFIKIHLNLANLSDKEKLTSWIYRITRNTILDYYKKNKPGTELKDVHFEPAKEESYNLEMLNCLKPFINQLPPQYKEALIETELGSLSQKEYAEKAGISYSGAKSRVQRARKMLFELFNDCCSIHADKYGNIYEHTCKKGNC